jgi:hypothetical protein
MSGGCYDYPFIKMDTFIEQFETNNDKRREAFRILCGLVSIAMREIEWVDSYDTEPGDEYDAIDAALNFKG